MTWANFLLSITGPVVVRVLSVLGLGVVTYTGFSSFLTLVYNNIQTNLSSIPAEIVNVLFLCGVPQGIGIVLSALAARFTLEQVSRIQRVV